MDNTIENQMENRTEETTEIGTEAERTPLTLEETLSYIASPARSNKHGFYETEKLKRIEELLREQNSPYKYLCCTGAFVLYGREPLQEGQSVLLLSSHADIVSNIKKPYSEKTEDGYYKGTYDNLGTNGALTYLMATDRLPKEAVVAFTCEEETGSCLGAEKVFEYITKRTGKKPFVMALDVTDEGYEENQLASIEGYHPYSEKYNDRMANILLSIEGEEQSFRVLPIKKKSELFPFPKEYQVNSLTVFDESIFYARKNTNSFSICLPGDGEMHSDSGFYVKAPVMEGYALTVEAVANAITGNKERVEELKPLRDALVRQARELPFRKKSYSSGYYSGYYSSSKKKEEDEYEQMSLYDYPSFAMENPRYYEKDSDEIILEGLDDDAIDLLSDAYEIAGCYNNSQRNMFIDDFIYGYPEYEENEFFIGALSRIFTMVHSPEEYLEEDDDYDYDYD